MDGAEAVCPRTFGGAFATVVVVALEGAIAQLGCCCSTVSSARVTQPAVSSFAATTRDGGCRLPEGRAPARRKAVFRPRE